MCRNGLNKVLASPGHESCVEGTASGTPHIRLKCFREGLLTERIEYDRQQFPGLGHMKAFSSECLPQVLNGFGTHEVARTFPKSAHATNQRDDEIDESFSLFDVILYRPVQHATHSLRLADGASKPVWVSL